MCFQATLKKLSPFSSYAKKVESATATLSLPKMTTINPLWDGFAYKPHQEYGVRWMIARENDEIKGGLLCDEMGLGKTIQMLGLIKETGLKKTLLVAPVAVLNQWKDTAIRCQVNVLIPSKTSWKLVSPMFPQKPTLYIIGYEALSAKISSISTCVFDRVVFDEAQRLGVPKIAKKIIEKKYIDKLNYRTAAQVNAHCKWFLTATPVVNSEDDVRSLFALMEHKLVNKPIHELMSVFGLARSMEQLRSVLPDAPAKPIIKQHKLDFESKKEEDFYIGIQSNVERQLAYKENALEVLRLILLLRQLSIHPQVYIAARKNLHKNQIDIKNWTEASTKFIKTKQLIESESHEHHKWIVFCHFHEEMNLLKEYLRESDKIRYIETYSGSLNHMEKEETLIKVREPFKDGEAKADVLLIQLKAGGVGLNLQEFDRIIFNSPWWTQAAIDQGVGRAVRIGQKNQVIVHKLMLKQEDTGNVRNIDLWMKMKAVVKERLNAMVLGYADSNLSV